MDWKQRAKWNTEGMRSVSDSHAKRSRNNAFLWFLRYAVIPVMNDFIMNDIYFHDLNNMASIYKVRHTAVWPKTDSV